MNAEGAKRQVSADDIKRARAYSAWLTVQGNDTSELDEALVLWGPDSQGVPREQFKPLKSAISRYNNNRAEINRDLQLAGKMELSTVVVNLVAGPGAGKTTCAFEITEKLKKGGYIAEYVGEYAKELIYEGHSELLDGSAENQRALYAEQLRRVSRYIDKVDFVVTDSPPLLSAVYLLNKDEEFLATLLADHAALNTFNIFLDRGTGYVRAGRLHTLEEALRLDEQVKVFLEKCRIHYATYDHDTIDLAIENMKNTHTRLNESPSLVLEAPTFEPCAGVDAVAPEPAPDKKGLNRPFRELSTEARRRSEKEANGRELEETAKEENVQTVQQERALRERKAS